MTHCGICNAELPKYKCPACEIRYCSIACYRPHKAEHEKSKPNATGEPVPLKPLVAEERDGEGKGGNETDVFAPLLKSPEIQQMLTSPSLRQHLLSIHRATLEPPPAFVHRGRGFRSRGRGGRGGWGSTPRPWNAEKGVRAGVGRVRRLREENVEVEEFMNMVMSLVEKETISSEL